MPHKILVVDDEDQVRSVIQRILETFGYEVVTARDGSEGLKLALADETLDLVLADVVMPVMGGFEMATELLQHRPKIEVIFMSAYTGDAQLAEQVAAGRARFLAKPFKPSELARKVEIALL